MGIDDLLRAGRFAAVGAANTALDVAVFAALALGAGLALVPSNAAAYGVASTASYFANRMWTFRGKTAPASLGDYLRFQMVNGTGFVLATIVLVIAAAHVPTLAAKLGSVVVSFCWSFLVLDRAVWNRTGE